MNAFFYPISRAQAEKLLAHFPCCWYGLDVSSVLKWSISTPGIFMGRGNFVTELDLQGSAEIHLVIPAGTTVWYQ